MNGLNITGTAQNLDSQVAPFLPGYTFTFVNASAANEIVQECDTEAGDYTTVAEVDAGETVTATVTKSWIKLASSGLVVALGN